MKLSGKKSYYKNADLRFHCTGCGKCCYGDPNTHYIAISDQEAVRIQNHLKISRENFRQTYTEVLPWGERGIRLRANSVCPFLVKEKCQIYRHRPAQCQSYPFWPEVVGSRSDWLSEARRCEGINQGEIIPLDKITQQLKLCSD